MTTKTKTKRIHAQDDTHPFVDALPAPEASAGTTNQSTSASGADDLPVPGQHAGDTHDRFAGNGDHPLDPDQRTADIHERIVGVTAESHAEADTQGHHALGDLPPVPGQPTGDTHTPYAGNGDHPLDPDQTAADTQKRLVGVTAESQRRHDSQCGYALGDLSPVPGHPSRDTQRRTAGNGHHPPAAEHRPIDTHAPLVDGGWMELRIWAEMFEDIQKSRMANMNRALRGGVSPDVYDLVLESIVMTENEAKKGMEACLKRVAPEPILTWINGIRGLGYPSMARLLGHLGHPRHATPHRWVSGKAPEEHVCPLDAEGKPAHCNKDRHLVELEPYERTVSQLWAYCGHGDPTRRRRAGATAEEMFACGNPTLKTIVWLISTNLIRAGRNPYREVYDEARIDYVDRVHAVPCVRCGPSGKPAQPGSPWSKGHQDAAAIRLVGKTVLRDLWVVAGR